MNWAWKIKHDGSSDVGSKKRSVLRNFLSQPARSASNEEEPMRPPSRRRVLGVTASLVIAALSPAIAQEQSHTAKGPETSLISTGLTGQRAFRQKMDGRAADRQLQGPDRQAGDQAAAGHLLRSA